MSTVRHTLVIAVLVALTVMMTLVGCEPDRKGTALENQAPIIGIVNTPPDEADFSRNPELNWYATDIDGYISFFRHAVIVDTLLKINGIVVTPEEYIAQAADDMYDWDTLIVDLDHPQSSATINLFADTLDPVNTFISQYFFVQACDDQGAMSEIAFRKYSRNNHYPNTHHRSGDLFINALNANSAANGISVSWDGADSTDWGRTDPPLEFEWRLYGPYATDADVYVNMVQEDCVYDPTSGTYINCRNVFVLDIDAIADTMYVDPGDDRPAIPVAQPIAHSKGPNFANDPNDTWVTETETTIYNVFKGLNLQNTSQYKFVFWVRARDDGYVPDPTPSFSMFNVIEALFERDVAVIDETVYNRNAGRWCPRHMDSVVFMFNDYIHESGYTSFDTMQDLFYTTGQKSYFVENSIAGAPFTVIDALSHKVLILHKDMLMNGISFEPNATVYTVFLGLAQGATSWVFSRNITSQNQAAIIPGTIQNMNATFTSFFGVNQVGVEAFNHYTLSTAAPDFWIRNPIFLEEFIGAYPAHSEYPLVELLYSDSLAGETTSRLDSMYVLWSEFIGRAHKLQGMPMVGVAYKSQIATPLFLYYSRLGESSIYHGKVCAVRAASNDTRTACFLFPPLAMDPEPMQETFQLTLDYLIEKFSSVQGAAKPGYSSDPATLEYRKQLTDEYLYYINNMATDEEKEQLGISIKPFVVH
ncbi:MAG: hypothetical protein R3F48_05750 [Candidatus Zixiibacteriota bacterium]